MKRRQLGEPPSPTGVVRPEPKGEPVACDCLNWCGDDPRLKDGRARPCAKALTWTCHVCGELRHDVFIGVYRRDVSKEIAPYFDDGTITENVRYCLDRLTCARGATTYRHLKKP